MGLPRPEAERKAVTLSGGAGQSHKMTDVPMTALSFSQGRMERLKSVYEPGCSSHATIQPKKAAGESPGLVYLRRRG